MRNKTTFFKTVCAGAALTSVAGCGVDLGGAVAEGADDAGRAAQALSPGEPVCITVQRGADPGGVTDAVLWHRAPRWNDGSSTTLSTGTSAAGGLRRSLLRFELPGIPAGAEVVSASLSLAQTHKTVDSAVRVHRVTTAWNESTVTWSSFGDAFDPTVAASFTAGAGVGLRSADITALAQAWVSGESANHGVLLEEDPVQSTGYRSSEKPLIEQRPLLDLCYVPRDGAGGSGGAGAGGGGASSPVVVTSPAAGAESSYRQSTIHWEPIAGASSYHLEIDDDPTFRSPEVDTLVTGTSFALGGTALALNDERSWPAYVRINGERWNAGTFAPATVRGSVGGSSLAVGSDGTVYWSLVDDWAMSLRTSGDWGTSLRLSWPWDPGHSAVGIAPDGEPWVVWTEQVSSSGWGAFYARRDDGYASHLIHAPRDHGGPALPLFPADGTVRWAAASSWLRTGYLYTLDGVSGALEEELADWSGSIVELDAAVGPDGGLLAVLRLDDGWGEGPIVLVDLDDPSAAPTMVGSGYRPSLDVAADGTIHVLYSSSVEQLHASSADGFRTVTTVPCRDGLTTYRKAARVDAHGTLWFLGGAGDGSEARLCKSTDAGRTWTYTALPPGHYFALAVGPDDLVHIASGRNGGEGSSYANSLGAFLATNLTPTLSLGSPAIAGQEVTIPAGADDPDGDELSGEAVLGHYWQRPISDSDGSFWMFEKQVYNIGGALSTMDLNILFRLPGQESWSTDLFWYDVWQRGFPAIVEVYDIYQDQLGTFVIDAWDSADDAPQVSVQLFEEAARASWTGQPALSIPLTGVPSDVPAVLRLSATDGTNTVSRERSFGHTGQQTLVLGALSGSPGAAD
ncbi:DNRLRE domain-containing protein [Sorangium sp. So ce1389]|uniref:DNRLRE domain-containing protein n=1 Tax=Sorangium sp. So ce1389 TaxID=3133336 RepID=UPI003F6314B2